MRRHHIDQENHQTSTPLPTCGRQRAQMEPRGRKNQVFRPFHRDQPVIAPHRVLIASPAGHIYAGQEQDNPMAPSKSTHLGTGRRERAQMEHHSLRESGPTDFYLDFNLVNGLPVFRNGKNQQDHRRKYPEPPRYHP